MSTEFPAAGPIDADAGLVALARERFGDRPALRWLSIGGAGLAAAVAAVAALEARGVVCFLELWSDDLEILRRGHELAGSTGLPAPFATELMSRSGFVARLGRPAGRRFDLVEVIACSAAPCTPDPGSDWDTAIGDRVRPLVAPGGVVVGRPGRPGAGLTVTEV